MKNSRRSDKEIAKDVGVSQPTVTRARKRLEKEGVIKEYTIIPDFRKLGFEIAAVTLVKFMRELSAKELEEARKYSKDYEKKRSGAVLMAMNGIGLGYSRIFISFHKNYASYVKDINDIWSIPNVDQRRLDSFVISLLDEKHFQPLTLSVIANYLLKTK
jgi:DNA-binding Lrp family transcriptional regulator